MIEKTVYILTTMVIFQLLLMFKNLISFFVSATFQHNCIFFVTLSLNEQKLIFRFFFLQLTFPNPSKLRDEVFSVQSLPNTYKKAKKLQITKSIVQSSVVDMRKINFHWQSLTLMNLWHGTGYE